MSYKNAHTKSLCLCLIACSFVSSQSHKCSSSFFTDTTPTSTAVVVFVVVISVVCSISLFFNSLHLQTSCEAYTSDYHQGFSFMQNAIDSNYFKHSNCKPNVNVKDKVLQISEANEIYDISKIFTPFLPNIFFCKINYAPKRHLPYRI